MPPTNPPRTATTQRRRRLATADEVLAIVPIASSSLYELVRQRRLPGVVRVGRRLLFDLDVLEEWISNGGHGSRS